MGQLGLSHLQLLVNLISSIDSQAFTIMMIVIKKRDIIVYWITLQRDDPFLLAHSLIIIILISIIIYWVIIIILIIHVFLNTSWLSTDCPRRYKLIIIFNFPFIIIV